MRKSQLVLVAAALIGLALLHSVPSSSAGRQKATTTVAERCGSQRLHIPARVPWENPWPKSMMLSVAD
jgi:hypothetical protein